MQLDHNALSLTGLIMGMEWCLLHPLLGFGIDWLDGDGDDAGLAFTYWTGGHGMMVLASPPPWVWH